jgi:hypothetical protein
LQFIIKNPTYYLSSLLSPFSSPIDFNKNILYFYTFLVKNFILSDMHRLFLLFSGCLLITAPFAAFSIPVLPAQGHSGVWRCDTAVPSGCSVITVSKGEQVLFASNDDYILPDGYYWVDPPSDGRYGVIWIGKPDNVQQGINECGLAYDANGLPRMTTNPHPERIPVTGDYTVYPIEILHTCATVQEVVDWVNAHQWHPFMHDQMHFADASGDAVILSAGSDGEVAFTRKPAGDGFLVSTNFNVVHPSNGYGYPCWRYDRAQELLGQILGSEAELTVEDAAGVLNAIAQQGASSWTISSLVADLTHGMVYLYYFWQFDRPVVLSVADELASPREPGPLSRLFPDEVQQEAARRYQQIQSNTQRCQWFGTLWLIAVALSLLLMVALVRRQWLEYRFWLPAALVLGPLALIIRLISGRTPHTGLWRTAVLEAAGNMMPPVVAFVLFLVLLLYFPAAQGSQLLQLALILLLPLLVGWLIFHGPMLARLDVNGPLRFAVRRLPQVLVASNLGLGGACLLTMPLLQLLLKICPVMPLQTTTLLDFWLAAAAGAVTGIPVLMLYERWAVKRGFQAWSILAGAGGEIRTPSWRRLWWWILLSYAVLLAGIIAGARLQ